MSESLEVLQQNLRDAMKKRADWRDWRKNQGQVVKLSDEQWAEMWDLNEAVRVAEGALFPIWEESEAANVVALDAGQVVSVPMAAFEELMLCFESGHSRQEHLGFAYPYDAKPSEAFADEVRQRLLGKLWCIRACFGASKE